MQGTIGFTGTLSGQIDDSGSGGTSNYNELTNKPSINSVPLVGNKTTEDLHLFTGDYDDLNDKPSVNGITLSGNKTTADLGLFSGNYNDLTNKPTLFSGDYNDLTNKPTLFSGDYNDLTNKPTLFDGDYDSLTDRPTINNVVLTGNKTTADLGLFSGNYNDLTNKPTLFDGDYDSLSSRPQINGNLLTGNKTTADLGLFSGNYNDLTNKPTLFSGDYNDLTNKPYIPDLDFDPAGAVTGEVEKIELDSTVYEVVDAAARGIIGDGQLDPGFTATNLTGAANELKSNLTDLQENETISTGMVVPVNVTRVGNLVTLCLTDQISRTWGAYETYNIGTLPTKYRPIREYCVPCVVSDRDKVLRFIIKTTGTIDVYNPAGAIGTSLVVIKGATITFSLV